MPKKVEQLSLLRTNALDALAAQGKDAVADWTAQHEVDWAAILGALVAVDAGLMIRSADQGRAVAVGLFAGGTPIWHTCRDVSELSAYMGAVQGTLEELLGDYRPGPPTAKARAARKRR